MDTKDTNAVDIMYDMLVEEGSSLETIMSNASLRRRYAVGLPYKLEYMENLLDMLKEKTNYLNTFKEIKNYNKAVDNIAIEYARIIKDSQYRKLVSEIDMFMALHNIFKNIDSKEYAKYGFNEGYLLVHKARKTITPEIFEKVGSIATDTAYDIYYDQPRKEDVAEAEK